MIYGTIVANNGLHQAITLAKSVKLHQPNVKFVVCIVDKNIHPKALECEYFNHIILAKDLGIPQFETFIFQYEQLEACQVLKAFFLNYILRAFNDERKFVYLDSDQCIFSALNEIEEELDNHSVILVPNLLFSVDISLQWHGFYNDGFIAIARSPNAEHFINWWLNRSARYCVQDWERGFIHVQRWLNLAPTYFDIHILKNEGYNVAFWNLKERNIKKVGDDIVVGNNKPLKIFKFEQLLGTLMLHASKSFNLSLRTLFENYYEQLVEAGLETLRQEHWSYSFFDSGELITKQSREKYRNELGLQSNFPNPFVLSNKFKKPKIKAIATNEIIEVHQHVGKNPLETGTAEIKLSENQPSENPPSENQPMTENLLSPNPTLFLGNTKKQKKRKSKKRHFPRTRNKIRKKDRRSRNKRTRKNIKNRKLKVMKKSARKSLSRGR